MNLIRQSTLRRKLSAWSDRARRGVAAVEFALTLPIWATLILGIGDGTYYLLVNERADRIASSIADVTTQYSKIHDTDITDIFNDATLIMQPYAFGANGVVILTSVYQPQTTCLIGFWRCTKAQPIVEWQRYGGGTLPQTSQIGRNTPGSLATLPRGLALNDYDNVIIAEVYYNFNPLFFSSFDTFSNQLIYRTAYYRPRIQSLTAITPPGS